MKFGKFHETVILSRKVIWSYATPTSRQITLEQKAAHKKPVSDW